MYVKRRQWNHVRQFLGFDDLELLSLLRCELIFVHEIIFLLFVEVFKLHLLVPQILVDLFEAGLEVWGCDAILSLLQRDLFLLRRLPLLFRDLLLELLKFFHLYFFLLRPSFHLNLFLLSPSFHLNFFLLSPSFHLNLLTESQL